MDENKHDEELEFIESLYDESEEKIKEIYKEQKKNRDNLLQELALIMLTYNVLDGLMSLTNKDKKKEYNRLSNLILRSAKGQGETQGKIINDILASTVNKTFDFYSYNAGLKDVKKIIDNNFENKHFSERVWEQESKVAENLHKQIKNFLDGRINVNQIKKDIERTYNSGAYNSKRLVETEVNRCEDEAFRRFCKEVGVKKVRRNEVLDSKTCEECARIDGKVYDLDDAPGVVHPLCRGFNTIEDDDTLNSGAKSGALTSKNDPTFKKRDRHAEQYYEMIRKRNQNMEVKQIANNTGLNTKTIDKVYNHVFINKYDLAQGYDNFAPDYDMAQSWQRLREGKNIQKHDLIMLKHERLEYELMNRYNMKYEKAHGLTEKKYNYAKALIEYLKKNNLG